MNCFKILTLLGTLFLSPFLLAQASLTDAQVTSAIHHALTGKHHQIGLTLNDLQTNLLSGLACETCKTTGYTIFVYTPESWIELQAIQARREMMPFGLIDVTPEMRLPYIHVLASPSRPEYLNSNGMAMASSVHRIVLSNTDRTDVVQPLSESHSEVESNSALRSFTQASAGSVFSMEDVERLRSEDPKNEFFIVVVGDNQNKYFKVKSRFFNQLFGQTNEPRSAEPRMTSPQVAAARKSIINNSSTSGQAEVRLTEPTTPNVTGTPSVAASDGLPVVAGKNSGASQESPNNASLQPNDGPLVASTRPNPVAAKAKPVPLPKAVTGTVSAGQDRYQYDNALIAEWWNLRRANANGLPNAIANCGNSSGAASIGAWCDERPRSSHDGLRIDRIAPNGPADQGGLQVGDKILAVDGVYVITVEELMDNIRCLKPGTKVALRYRRYSTIYDTFVVIGTDAKTVGQPVAQ